MKTKTTTTFRALIRDACTFAEKLDILTTEAGLSRGRAVLFARKVDPSGYNEWQRDRVLGRIRPKRGSVSVLQHFRFIGA